MKIFVFGSNLAGRHGAGSAKAARLYHGAINGIGVGISGNSYAIPTKDRKLRVLPISEISKHIQIFLQFAKDHPEMEFHIVAIGCGLAGYTPAEIGPMFQGAPNNCYLPKEFLPHT